MNEYVITVDDNKKFITVLNNSEIKLNGSNIDYEIIPSGCESYLMRLNEKVYELTAVKKSAESYLLIVGGHQFEVTVRTALQEKAIKLLEDAQAVSHHLREVKAPMPGLLLKIKRNEGDTISHGDSIMILEAMKMENDLRAPAAGQIKKILVKEGTAVEKGAVLFTIE
ncbi:MAG: biotin/lipoyl-binding protein [Ignavibacteriaceae bacterium]|nr:biotin/lipoyl-binding protein [Ignavibacteriaceae bacterium]